MAREKGTGSLQLEKSGRWTMRVGIKGKRYSGSTSTSPKGLSRRKSTPSSGRGFLPNCRRFPLSLN